MIRARGARVLCIPVAAAMLVFSPVAVAIPTDPEAKAHLDRGNAAYSKGDFDVAISEYRKGFEAQDDPAFLYSWAQAERKRGKCAAAVRLYQRYLATNPPELSADYARDGILKCADELAGDDPTPPGGDSETGADPPADPVTEPEPVPEPAPPKDDRAKWPRDPLAIALVSVGAAATVAGVAVLAVASVEDGKSAPNYGAFDDKLTKVRNLVIGGGVVLGVGVGVLAGGIARWMILRGRETKSNGAGVSAMIGRGTLGLSLTRRF